MGPNTSTLSKQIAYHEHDAQIFLQTYMPDFLNSEFCNVSIGEYTDPTQFMVAFQSFVFQKGLKLPYYLLKTNQYAIVYYFNMLKAHSSIYVTGSYAHNVLVGVSIKKWPGTRLTDPKTPAN
jgi:hypothetical protein